MALVLTEELNLLNRSARDYLRKHCPVPAFRALRDANDAGSYCAGTWRKMCDFGWPAMLLPEEYGGADFGYLGMGCVLEQQGGVLAASPLFATAALCAPLVEGAGSAAQKEALLPQVASGDLTLALALEEGAHHDPCGIGTRAEALPEGYRISGRKAFVVDGCSADKLLIAARTSGSPGEMEGLSLFIADRHSPGLRVEPSAMMDSRDAADIEISELHLPDSALLGEVGRAGEVLDPVLDRARALIAAEMLGGAQECFDRTLEYLKQREQFGVKIGSFQALKHRAAKLYVEIELARAVVHAALSAIDERSGQVALLASLAKARVTELYIAVTNEAVQMHGGVGVTDELDIGLFLKRARVAAQMLGDAGFNRDRFASLSGY